MSEKNKQELQVAALKNGTVIDHIPSDKLFTVVALLGLQNSDSNITIGNNFESKKLGKKGIIKVADRFFTDEEISRLSVVAPNVKLNIIRDYEVVEKKQVLMPEELRGIVKCATIAKKNKAKKQLSYYETRLETGNYDLSATGCSGELWKYGRRI